MQPLQDIVVIDGHMQTMYMAVYADKLLLLDGGCLCDVDLIIQTSVTWVVPSVS